MDHCHHHHHVNTLHLDIDKWFGHNLRKGSIIFSKCEIVANSVILVLVIILLICGGSIFNPNRSDPYTLGNILHVMKYFRAYVFGLAVFRVILLLSSIRLHKGANNDIKKLFWPYLIVEVINFPVNLYIMLFFIFCPELTSIDVPAKSGIVMALVILIYSWDIYGYFRVLEYYQNMNLGYGNDSGEPDNVEAEAFRPTYPIPITTTVLMTSEPSHQNYDKNNMTTDN